MVWTPAMVKNKKKYNNTKNNQSTIAKISCCLRVQDIMEDYLIIFNEWNKLHQYIWVSTFTKLTSCGASGGLCQDSSNNNWDLDQLQPKKKKNKKYKMSDKYKTRLWT